MSVLIRGLEIPKNCSECPVALSGKYCRINQTYTTYIKLPMRPENCPLVELPEHHGEQKWIPCSEALPKDHEYVLLTIRRLNKAYNQLPFISTGYVSWNGMCWWCAHDGDCKSNDIDVMAWRPLPEPYRGDTE